MKNWWSTPDQCDRRHSWVCQLFHKKNILMAIMGFQKCQMLFSKPWATWPMPLKQRFFFSLWINVIKASGIYYNTQTYTYIDKDPINPCRASFLYYRNVFSAVFHNLIHRLVIPVDHDQYLVYYSRYAEYSSLSVISRGWESCASFHKLINPENNILWECFCCAGGSILLSRPYT